MYVADGLFAEPSAALIPRERPLHAAACDRGIVQANAPRGR
jgi:hypothetical protein